MNPPLSMEEAVEIVKRNAASARYRLEDDPAALTKAAYGVLRVVQTMEAMGYQVQRPGLVVVPAPEEWPIR